MIDQFTESVYFSELFEVTYHEFPFLNYELYLLQDQKIRKLMEK